jgi:hypothetical protein
MLKDVSQQPRGHMSALVSFRTALPALAALTLACEGSHGPSNFLRTYALREVQGDPLPTVLYTNEYVAVHVLSDTIRLRADGTGSISGVRSSEPLQPLILPQPPTWSTADIRFRRGMDRIEIDYVCPANANCAPPPHLIAVEGDNRLQVTWAPGMTGRSPMIYVAVE